MSKGMNIFRLPFRWERMQRSQFEDFDADEMQRMDHATINDFGIPGRVLMESAGRGTVRVFLNLLEELAAPDVAVAAGRLRAVFAGVV